MFDFGQKIIDNHPGKRIVEHLLYEQAPCSIYSIIDVVIPNALPFVKILDKLEISSLDDAAKAYLSTVGNSYNSSDIKIATTCERVLIEQYVLDKKIKYIYQLLCMLFKDTTRENCFYAYPEFLLNYVDNEALSLILRIQDTGNPLSIVDRIQMRLFDNRERVLSRGSKNTQANFGYGENVFLTMTQQKIDQLLSSFKNNLKEDNKRIAMLRLLMVFLQSLEIKHPTPLETLVEGWKANTFNVVGEPLKNELGYLLDPTPLNSWIWSSESGHNKIHNKPLYDFQCMTVLLHLYSLKEFLSNGLRRRVVGTPVYDIGRGRRLY